MQTHFQFWFVETTDVVEFERGVLNGKNPQHTSSHFLKYCKKRSFTHVLRWLWEKWKDTRNLRISAERNTSARITDDISLLNWISHFAMQFLEQDENWSWMENSVAQFGEKIWFHTIGEEGHSSFVKRIIQGIFVGHHDSTRTIFIHYQEWDCARHKSDKTDIEWRLEYRRTWKMCLATFCGPWWLRKHDWRRSSSLTKKERDFYCQESWSKNLVPICRWNVQKMRSESSEYMWKTTGAYVNSWIIKIALESCFEEHAQEVWVRKLRKTTLLNMYKPILMETILKVFSWTI